MKTFLISALILVGSALAGQNMQVVFDLDAMGNPLAKVFPFELASKGDTTVVLEAQYGLQNQQERFTFIFTVKSQGQTFFKTSEHTYVEFQALKDSVRVQSFEKMTYAPDVLDFKFIFTAGDLGYEDNDISLQRLGGVHTLVIHQLPEMTMFFPLIPERYGFLKDLQNSLRVAYRKGDTTGGSAVRGSFGNEKSSRNTRRNR